MKKYDRTEKEMQVLQCEEWIKDYMRLAVFLRRLYKWTN